MPKKRKAEAVYNIKHAVKITAAAYVSCAAITSFLLMNTTSIMALFLFAALAVLFKIRFKGAEKGTLAPSVFCGILFSLFICLFKMRWILESESFFWAFVYPVGLFLFFEAFMNVVYTYIKNITLCTETVTDKKAKVFWISVAIMEIMWLPYFLYYFPGNLTADSISQLCQAFGFDELSNHHPLLHTGMIRLLVSAGKEMFGDMTKAVAFYSVCQSFILACSFSYLVVTLYGYGYKKTVLAAVVLFYAVPSYNGNYSVTMWKDIWFAAAAVVFCTTLWRLIIRIGEDNKIPLFEGIMLFVSGVAFCLFRSNGLFAYIFLFAIIVIVYAKKNIKFVGITALALAAALIIHGPIYRSFGAKPPEPTESLAIPQQQIAAVITAGYKLDAEHEELISHLMDIDKVEETYSRNNADPIKFYIRNNGDEEYITKHKGEFFKMWLSIGLKHPVIYVQAFVDQTFGYYYPDVQYWIYANEIHNDHFEDLHQDRKLPEGLSILFEKWIESYKKYPVWGLLWSIGTMTWVCVFAFGASYMKQKKTMLLVFVPVICVILTLLMATPIFAEFRYAYGVFTNVPLLCTLPFYKKEQQNATSL